MNKATHEHCGSVFENGQLFPIAQASAFAGSVQESSKVAQDLSLTFYEDSLFLEESDPKPIPLQFSFGDPLSSFLNDIDCLHLAWQQDEVSLLKEES